MSPRISGPRSGLLGVVVGGTDGGANLEIAGCAKATALRANKPNGVRELMEHLYSDDILIENALFENGPDPSPNSSLFLLRIGFGLPAIFAVGVICLDGFLLSHRYATSCR